MSSSRRFCWRRAMNSRSAFVTAAFLGRSPLTSRARSSKSGSIDRFVAMCVDLHTPIYTRTPHLQLHLTAARLSPSPAVAQADRPAENEPTGRRVGIAEVITLSFELHRAV